MEIKCPACSKMNEVSPCSRCGGDLEPLFAIREAADFQLNLAGKALREGRIVDARSHAEHSWSLYHSPEAAKVAFLSCASERDPAAWQWRKRVTALGKSGET